ncbi:hypothetical protein [Cohnella hashimotonis]|uniref:NodB homology domain-containing protein n=1 Tax=Cohnella hashimotonis TaxID=2826895 RepID=A0ABT6TGI5_9BACL|nr:hypothetical protein [Cohnella hashimotonis]MDI4645039.1 hypothetical protein [Cohnella hashimotonis]
MVYRLARLGVLFEQTTAIKKWANGIQVFEGYVRELLEQRSIPYSWLDRVEEAVSGQYDLVLAVLVDDLPRRTQEALLDYMNRGGIVVGYGSLNGLARDMGFRPVRHAQTGYAYVDGGEPAQTGLRFTQGCAWIKASGEGYRPQIAYAAAGRLEPEGYSGGELPALVSIRVGKGKLERWAIDIPNTIVRLQQGDGPVLSDGIPAADGTAELNDGLLKADDGGVMDWDKDRLQTPNGTPYMAYPYADYWRERWLSHLVSVCAGIGLTLPFADLLPDGVEGIAAISFDSDMNDNDSAETALRILSVHQVRSSWCILEPGYRPSIYDAAREDGHEIGLHFNAMESQGGRWSQEEFADQCRWFKSAAGEQRIGFNKNHYTRFEGWDDLFLWCEQNGIPLDQSRGPSKRGNVGFLFGTAQPYRPIASLRESNRLFQVLEVGFLSQDMGLDGWGDRSAIGLFLDTVQSVRGVAHFLFHQIYLLTDPAVREGFNDVVEQAKAKGFEFWTSGQLVAWENTRRSLKWSQPAPGRLSVERAVDGPGVVVYIPVPDGAQADGPVEYRYGHPCRRTVVHKELKLDTAHPNPKEEKSDCANSLI